MKVIIYGIFTVINVILFVKHAQEQQGNVPVVMMDIICLIINVHHVFPIVKHVQNQLLNA